MVRFFILILSTATAGAVTLTLERAPDYALEHNPQLAAARLRIEEARGRLQQSGRLGNPELELDFTRHTIGPEGSAGIALMQRFPITARLRHERAVSRAELAAAEAEVRDAARKLAAEVRAGAVRMLALRGQRGLRTRRLAHSRELSDFLRTRVKNGEASAVDASQVELESSQIEIESLQLAADEAALLGELRVLLGVTGGQPIAITGDLAPPRAVPASDRAAGRPDILAAQARAEAARASVLEERARRWEDIGIGASYTRERSLDEPEPVETEQVIGLRFSLPLPLWNDNAGRIREAEAAAARAEKEADATRQIAHSEVAAARDAMRAYARLVGELDDKVLPAAARIEEQLQAGYSTGQSPLTDVLRARTRRLELERQRLDALRDYHLAGIRYEAARGHGAPSTRNFK